MNKEELRRMIQTYLDKLEYTHPPIQSDRFFQNSYAKWACRELLKEIQSSYTCPFELCALEILNMFADKMKQFACRNSKNSMGFVIAAETAEYFIEEYYQYKSRRKGA